jgi:hypothetical protein
MGARERLIDELRTHALIIGEVVLTSGQTAQYYVDAKRAVLRPAGFRAMAELVAARADVLDALDRALADDSNAWELRPDRTWVRRTPNEREPRSVQRELMVGHAARATEAQTQSA